jgi:CHAT domain-containing protein/Tfp pilus assembly protein PilF
MLFIFLSLAVMTSVYASGKQPSIEKGAAALQKGDYSGCRSSLSEALKSLKSSGARKEEAEAHYLLARCYFELRSYDESLREAAVARAIFEAIGDRAGILAANSLSIEALVGKRDFREAHRLVELSGKLMDDRSAGEATIDFLLARGLFYAEAVELELASANFEKALELARKSGDPSREARALIGQALANLYSRPYSPRKDLKKARDKAQAAQKLAFERSLSPYLQAQSLHVCTKVELNDDKSEAALKAALPAKEIYRLTGNTLREAELLTNLGYIYNILMKDQQKGLACYEEAARLYKSGNDIRDLLSTYSSILQTLTKNETASAAKRAEITAGLRQIAEKDGDHKNRISAFDKLIIELSREDPKGNNREEINDYRDSMIKAAHTAGDTKEEIRALMSKADNHSFKPEKSLELYEKALSLYKSLGKLDRLDDPWFYSNYGEGTFYEKMAPSVFSAGDYTKAMSLYRKAAECNAADGRSVNAAKDYILLMNSAIFIYDINTCIDAFDKAVSIINSVEDDTWRSRFYGDLMSPLQVMVIRRKTVTGEKFNLRDSLSALLMDRIMKNSDLVARMDKVYDKMFERASGKEGLTGIYARLDYALWALLKKDYRRARDEYETALSLIRKEIDDKRRYEREWRCLSTLADLSLLNGKPDKAVEYCREARDILQAAKDEYMIRAELAHSAVILRKAGKTEEAGKLDELARQLRKKSSRPRSDIEKAMELWADEHDAQGALKYCQKALASCRKPGFRTVEANIECLTGNIYDETGKLPEAIEHYRSAMTILKEQGDLPRLCNVSLSCGKALEKQSNDGEALAVYLDMLNRIISQWTSNDSTVSQLRLSADSEVISLFDRAIRLLLKSGKNDEALKYLELSHSMELLDSVKLNEIKLSDREMQALVSQMATLRQRMTLIEGEISQTGEEKKKTALKDILSSTRQEFFTTVNSIKSRNPDMEQLLSVRSTDLAALQKKLPKDVLLLEYYPSEDMLYIFGITSDSFITRKLSIPRENLNKSVKSLHESISSPSGGSFSEEKKYLYSKLLEPVEDEMAKRGRLVIVPSGLLWYIPFEVLGPSDDRFVITSKPISYMSSANVLTMLSGEQSTRGGGDKLLAFGAPREANLPGAEEELIRIASLYRGSLLCTGNDATKENFFRNTGDKSIIHIASHSSLNTSDVNMSFIEFSGPEKKLYLGEIYGLMLDPRCLVALSSCSSAIGESNPGREFASLASAFTAAGSSTVIASQWRVDDQASEKLFVEFYGNLKKNEPRSDALRDAKLSLLKNKDTSHPFYWAPFVLLGDWR